MLGKEPENSLCFFKFLSLKQETRQAYKSIPSPCLSKPVVARINCIAYDEAVSRKFKTLDGVFWHV